jgi:hypothetical protein
LEDKIPGEAHCLHCRLYVCTRKIPGLIAIK